MLAGDLQRAVSGEHEEFVFNFGLYYAFERALPATARTAKGHQYKTLNTTLLADCQTSK